MLNGFTNKIHYYNEMDSMETSNDHQIISYNHLVPQLQDDLIKFSLVECLCSFRVSKDVNIKRAFYRSISLFVSALGRAHGLRQHSSFGIIDELKRRGLISSDIAQRLSLAVAVACHTRLVHYSSKKRQDDNMYIEDEALGGNKKLGELKKIVNINWLVKGLVATMALQEALNSGMSIQVFFAGFFYQEEILLTGFIMYYLGLHHELICFGETFYQKQSELNICEHVAFLRVCYACCCTRQYDRCLRLIKQFRKKFPKCPAVDIDSFFKLEETPETLGISSAEFNSTKEIFSSICTNIETELLLIEIECLRDLEQFDVALQKSDLLLKLNLEAAPLCKVLHGSGLCKIMVKKYREGLSDLRDHLKLMTAMNHQNLTSSVVITPQTLGYIAIALVLIGRKEQGLHRAREALHYANVTNAVSFFVEEQHNLIESITTCSQQQIEMMLLGEEDP